MHKDRNAERAREGPERCWSPQRKVNTVNSALKEPALLVVVGHTGYCWRRWQRSPLQGSNAPRGARGVNDKDETKGRTTPRVHRLKNEQGSTALDWSSAWFQACRRGLPTDWWFQNVVDSIPVTTDSTPNTQQSICSTLGILRRIGTFQ